MIEFNLMKNKDKNSIELPEGAAILFSEPLEGVVPDDIRQWLSDHDNERGLAVAMARVNNKVGLLYHDLNDPDVPYNLELKTIFNEWWSLEKELDEKIIKILHEENASGKANHNIAEKGLHYVIMPFMERNGFRDGAGWWVEKSKENNRARNR